MKIDLNKLNIVMASACMNAHELRKAANMPEGTYGNIRKGYNLRPSTVGKIAKALNVPVTDILLDEEAERRQQEDKELDKKVKLIARYTELAVKLSEFSLMNQADWKPEYNQEIADIRAELAQLRITLGMEDK